MSREKQIEKMAQYVEVGLLIDKLAEAREKVAYAAFNEDDFPVTYGVYIGLGDAISVVSKLPAADVVPRAEIESTLKYSKDTIKTEVAREIFEEMQVLLMLRMGVNEVIAELKKKYTEEQT